MSPEKPPRPGSEPPEILTSLPRTRPQRRSSKRDEPAPSAPRARARPAPRSQTPPRRDQSDGEPKAAIPPPPSRSLDPPTGAELVAALTQSATELASLGWAVGGRLVRSATSRLPRP